MIQQSRHGHGAVFWSESVPTCDSDMAWTKNEVPRYERGVILESVPGDHLIELKDRRRTSPPLHVRHGLVVTVALQRLYPGLASGDAWREQCGRALPAGYE